MGDGYALPMQIPYAQCYHNSMYQEMNPQNKRPNG